MKVSSDIYFNVAFWLLGNVPIKTNFNAPPPSPLVPTALSIRWWIDATRPAFLLQSSVTSLLQLADLQKPYFFSTFSFSETKKKISTLIWIDDWNDKLQMTNEVRPPTLTATIRLQFRLILDCTVYIFWEGHKNMTKSLNVFLSCTK